MAQVVRKVCIGLACGMLLMTSARAQTVAPEALPRGQGILSPISPAPALPGNPPPVFTRAANIIRNTCQPVAVPPTLEIEVLDPNVDARGNPAVLTCPVGVLTPGGPQTRLVVDIPPTVLVHRYYYTGDRDFQGPLLPGGPSIVVLNHPRTAERIYLPVQMLPGSPRVRYTASSVEYDYGSQGIIISFGWLCGRPKVTYRQGVPLCRQVENTLQRTKDATRRLIGRTGLPECHDKLVSTTKNVVETTLDHANSLGKRLLDPVVGVVKMTPVGTFFTSSPEDRAAHERDALVQRAGGAAQQQNLSISSNR